MSHRKVKVDFFREVHTPYSECGPSHKSREALGDTCSLDRTWAISEVREAVPEHEVISDSEIGHEVWGG